MTLSAASVYLATLVTLYEIQPVQRCESQPFPEANDKVRMLGIISPEPGLPRSDHYQITYLLSVTMSSIQTK
ncbi:hypothetical protein FVEG_17225 [Fusarium verticillioides 7600]|uniref:Uncharacterized protein n=1 Tax=Gibberella moniliformis (strain M3125 / FGSC 7600) TaxID=334819 RepID=W7MRE2_GIBM7|nr:hypothetical protein FVEG_17225 [Fusarium verticillioides 7600]EWG54018.1 hypothetical protein FVEG_17225 [Fusarium verticillioides 7600]